MGCGSSSQAQRRIFPGDRHRTTNPFSTSESDIGASHDDFEPASFEEAMKELFPDSMEAASMLDASCGMLAQHGFSSEVQP